MRNDYYLTLFRAPESRFHYLCLDVGGGGGGLVSLDLVIGESRFGDDEVIYRQ